MSVHTPTLHDKSRGLINDKLTSLSRVDRWDMRRRVYRGRIPSVGEATATHLVHLCSRRWRGRRCPPSGPPGSRHLRPLLAMDMQVFGMQQYPRKCRTWGRALYDIQGSILRPSMISPGACSATSSLLLIPPVKLGNNFALARAVTVYAYPEQHPKE